MLASGMRIFDRLKVFLSSLETSFASSSSPSLLHGGLGFREMGKKSRLL